jgi:hypothetical protein
VRNAAEGCRCSVETFDSWRKVVPEKSAMGDYGQVSAHSFSGSFSLRFFHSYVFSTTSPLRFPVRSGSLSTLDHLFSATYPVRF